MTDPGVVEDRDEDHDDDDDLLVELTVFLVLGGGLLALFLDLDFFWMIWVLGFAVVLPVVSILSNHYGPFVGGRSRDRDRRRVPERDQGRTGEGSALETLKERYARGEIDEAEFERRLERLVENEDVADVERRLGDRGKRDRETEFER